MEEFSEFAYAVCKNPWFYAIKHLGYMRANRNRHMHFKNPICESVESKHSALCVAEYCGALEASR